MSNLTSINVRTERLRSEIAQLEARYDNSFPPSVYVVLERLKRELTAFDREKVVGGAGSNQRPLACEANAVRALRPRLWCGCRARSRIARRERRWLSATAGRSVAVLAANWPATRTVTAAKAPFAARSIRSLCRLLARSGHQKAAG
jgi:hypothetical protein